MRLDPGSDDEVEQGQVPSVSDNETADKGGDASNSESDSESDGDDDNTSESLEDLFERVLKGISNGNDFLAILDASDQKRLVSPNDGNDDKPNTLHILATRDKKKVPKLDDKIEPLVRFLVKHPNNLLVVPDSHGYTPLYHAIHHKKDDIVRWMCDSYGDAKINAVFNVKNCIHLAIKRKVRSKFLNFLVEKASPAVLASKDSEGNTPLHLAVEYKRCRKGHLPIVELIATKSDEVVRVDPEGDFNKQGQSPYLVHAESCRDAIAKEKKERRLAEALAQGPGRTDMKGRADLGVADVAAQNKPQNVRVTRDAAPPRSVKTSTQGPRLVTQHNEAGKFAAPSRPVVTAIDSPAIRRPPAMDTAFSPAIDKTKLELTSKAAAESKESKVDPETVKGVERFLKLHYLRYRPYRRCMDILYGKNTSSDSELYFDLSGYSNMTKAQFGNLLSKLKFADILQYVAIPQIEIEMSTTGPGAQRDSRIKGRSSKSLGEGRSDFVHVFESLRKKGVNTILNIMVDDGLAVSHSDEAIENALRGMGVEIWDWKRTDLCSEVIYNLAPKVREVSLYWSGNNAVLRGWSEPGGLKRLGDLQVVRLNVQHGLESSERTNLYVREFCDRMRHLCPGVKVLRQGPAERTSASLAALRNLGDQGKNKSKHEWLRCMREFRQLLLEAEHYYDARAKQENRLGIRESIEMPIKIAIIDDGVDVKDLEYTFIGGRTFCTRDEEHNLNNPYYVSANGHGTAMARNVWDICPAVQFYVLRLDDHPQPGEEHVRQITPQSAAQAIQAAVKKKVHIISMSWTIDPPENDEGVELDKAIAEAKSQDILMFCAASDRGAKQIATYPSKAAPNKIFTIGAASAWGAADPRVGDLSGITLTFPGDKVDQPGSGDGAAREVSGSSVATAVGAGLAALILYCVQVAILQASDTEQEKLRAAFTKLRKHDVMLQAIKDIGTSEKSNHKFVEVWRLFSKKTEEREKTGQDKWIDLVADVGRTVCSRL